MPWSDLPVPVDVDPTTGKWSVDGQPMLLLPRHFFVYIQMEAEKRFGVEATASIFEGASRKAARLWCEREARTHGLDGVAVFRHYLARMSSRGYGRFAVERVDAANGTASVRLDHSIFVAEYGNVGRRVCMMFPPAFVGSMEYVAEAAGRATSLAAEEVQCAAEGHDHCRFEVRPCA